jgi:DNA-binding LacI/PurR family transcriptional regulator
MGSPEADAPTAGESAERGAAGASGATLAAVAAAVGVSRSTVSNAYNRPDQLSAALRSRVLAAAAAMGYGGPNPVARSLRTRQSHAVGLVFAETLGFAFRDPASVGFLAGLSDACEAGGKSLLLVPVPDDQGSEAIARAAVDGVVVYSLAAGDPHLAAVAARRVPVVVVESPDGLLDSDFVGVDDRGGIRAMGELLVELGHRDIAVVTIRTSRRRAATQGPLADYSDGTYRVMRERLEGIAAGISGDHEVEGGSAAGRVLVVERPTNLVSEGAAAVEEILRARPDVTAIVCLTDVLALGVLLALERRGISVPGEISVTGFDDVDDAASAGLTTVRQSLVDKGRVTGELLLARTAALIDGAAPTPPQRRILPTQLIVRRSTGPARTPH